MICPNCKAIIDDNSRFCTVCGFHITPQEKPAIKYNAPDLGFPSQPRQTPVKPVPNYTLQEQDSRTIILPDDQRGIVTPIGVPAKRKTVQKSPQSFLRLLCCLLPHALRLCFCSRCRPNRL